MKAGLTCSQVALDDHLVLLLVSSGDDQVVLGADEPQELLKPAQNGAGLEKHTRLLVKGRLDGRMFGFTSRPSWLSGCWSPSAPLSVSVWSFSQQI